VSNLSKSEQEIYDLRVEKIQFFLDNNQDAFPTEFKGTSQIVDIIKNHTTLKDAEHSGVEVKIHGRILNGRSFGKLSFFDLIDNSGKIQILVDSKTLSEEESVLFSKYDSGDIIGVKGEIMKTKKGQLSIKVSTSSILSKSLRTLPEKWHGLKDKETRFRQRYLDFIVNPDAKQTIEIRSKIINSIRQFMHGKDFIEVETPILQPKAGGAIAKPFITHHNALDVEMYLRIAPELYLKRMIVGGFEKVFELGRVFRNEGIDQTHSPEFTMMESYEAYTNVNGVIEMVENMCSTVFDDLELSTDISFDEKNADFSFPWAKASMFTLVSEEVGIKVEFSSDFNEVVEQLNKKDIEVNSEINTTGLHGAIVCSVVPQITDSVVSAINKFSSKEVLVVGPGIKTGLKVNIDNPKELGPDRIANSVGGYKKINKEVIIVDLGTATTFDVVNHNKEYLGGSIAPGIKISLDALISRTSSLKSVELKEPNKVIGKNTYEAIQSGLVLGHASMIDSMLEKIVLESELSPGVVVTGGLGTLIQPVLNINTTYERNLTLDGLEEIYNLNN
jgi:lysyl-tRNA synthetase